MDRPGINLRNEYILAVNTKVSAGLVFFQIFGIICGTFCGHAGKLLPPRKTSQISYKRQLARMSYGHFWFYRLTVRTSGFHPGNRSSILRRITSIEKSAS